MTQQVLVWNSTHLREHTIEQLQASLPESTAEVDVVMPYTHPTQAQQTREVLLTRAGTPMRLILVEDNSALGFIGIANRVFQTCNKPYFVYLAQDAFPGRFWLDIALQTIKTQQKGLLAFNDGKWFGQLAAFGLVQREWVEKIYHGPLFWPSYQSHYADTELTLIAQAQQQLAYHPHALLIEVDPLKEQKPTHPEDKQQFAHRKAHAFDGRVLDAALLNKFN